MEDILALQKSWNCKGTLNAVIKHPSGRRDKTMQTSTTHPTHDEILAASPKDGMSIIHE